MAGYFSGKAHGHLNQSKRFTNQLWVWCHCNLSTLSGLFLNCNLNRTKSLFPDILDELLFLCASSSVSSSHHPTNTPHVRVLNSSNQISLKSILNPGHD